MCVPFLCVGRTLWTLWKGTLKLATHEIISNVLEKKDIFSAWQFWLAWQHWGINCTHFIWCWGYFCPCKLSVILHAFTRAICLYVNTFCFVHFYGPVAIIKNIVKKRKYDSHNNWHYFVSCVWHIPTAYKIQTLAMWLFLLVQKCLNSPTLCRHTDKQFPDTW